MNKKVLFLIIGIILLVGLTLTYVFVTTKKGPVASNAVISSNKNVDTKSNSASVANNSQPGIYKDYSEEAVASTSGAKLLFFHAPWCPQCRAVDASIKSDGVPSGVTIFKVDYDTNQSLRQKYGVTIQTTFVKIDNRGNKISSYVAYEEPTIGAVERELLR